MYTEIVLNINIVYGKSFEGETFVVIEENVASLYSHSSNQQVHRL